MTCNVCLSVHSDRLNCPACGEPVSSVAVAVDWVLQQRMKELRRSLQRHMDREFFGNGEGGE